MICSVEDVASLKETLESVHPVAVEHLIVIIQKGGSKKQSSKHFFWSKVSSFTHFTHLAEINRVVRCMKFGVILAHFATDHNRATYFADPICDFIEVSFDCLRKM